MAEQAFVWTEENSVLILTMQAEGNNLMTGAFLDGFAAAMAEAEEMVSKKKYRGMIIRSGGRHFSVGADVDALTERSSAELPEWKSTDKLPVGHLAQKHCFTLLHDFSFPVISVVTGFCIGSGSEIAANSHFRIVEQRARVGQPEATFGILPALGGIACSIAHCGIQNAAEICIGGELFDADKAYAVGWANEVVGKKQSFDRAMQLIDYIDAQKLECSADTAAEIYRKFVESEATT